MALKRYARVRLEMVREKSLYTDIRYLDTPQKAAEFAKELYYQSNDKEHRCPCKEMLLTCCVSTKNEPLVIEWTSIGDSSKAIASVKEIFLPAILSNSTGIICVHNHPSGDPTPSFADNRMHKTIYEASKILGIELVDNIIISESRGYYSFKDGSFGTWNDKELQNAG